MTVRLFRESFQRLGKFHRAMTRRASSMAFVDVAGSTTVVVGTLALGFAAVVVDHRDRSKTYILTSSFMLLGLISAWAASRANKGLVDFLGPFDLGLRFSFILQQVKRRLGYH